MISGGRWDTQLRRLFGIKAAPVSPTIAPEIQPVLAVEDPAALELYGLRGILLADGFRTVSAVAGQLGQVALHNESPNTMCVVTALNIRSATNPSQFRIGIDARPAGLTLGGNKGVRDTRFISRPPVLGLYGGTNVASGLTRGFVEINTLAGSTQPFFVTAAPWVLFPDGQPLIIECQTANSIVWVSAVWYERPIEPSEQIR